MLEMLKNLKNHDGATLRKYGAVSYKSGWQVADYGVECKTAEAAAEAIREMNGSCGIWLEDGIYYIDHSMHVKTKKEALRIGREHKQISILKWADMSLVYC